MNFVEARKLSNYLSKEYSESIFRLLMTYQDISASEAASRLNVHIQTAQDFLETMASYFILNKREVYESKRPYFRYKLVKRKISFEIDLDAVLGEKIASKGGILMIRERKNSGAKFSVARNGRHFSSISVWIGEGRTEKERKINLTEAQGMFLFNLPFPDALPLSIDEIMAKSDVDPTHKPEILDIVNELIGFSVIEKTG
jgi:hypothetical protein